MLIILTLTHVNSLILSIPDKPRFNARYQSKERWPMAEIIVVKMANVPH